MMSIFFLFIPLILGIQSCGTGSDDDDSTPIVSSNAYSGHESDADANNFVNAYPSTVGTRLDNCQICHEGSEITYSDNGAPGITKNIANPCTYCHIRVFESADDYHSGYPSTYEDTLNPYGVAYKNAGRSVGALGDISGDDSDSDGYINSVEIADNRYPGDGDSKPGQPLAPIITLTWEQITAMASHSQFMLLNTTKQQYDDYLTFEGIKIKTLLESAGVNLTGATGITVFAPDGYQIDFSLADFDFFGPFPDGIFYQVPTFTDADMNFVNYPAALPTGLTNGDSITDLWTILAFKRDGQDLDVSYYDSTDGRIAGEGPYRIIRPQSSLDASPDTKSGRPDRGSRSSTYGDGWDFLGFDYDHNAGDAVKGTCVIRVDPMPAGYEEYDWKNGWALIQDKKVIIYGHGVQ